MKAVKITLAGGEYHLLFNGIAMFAFDDTFGGTSQFFDAIGKNDSGAFQAVCKGAAILAEQGELARRALGYESGAILTEETLSVCATPHDVQAIKSAAMNTILAGYGREVESDGPVDLGLIELEQKKTRK